MPFSITVMLNVLAHACIRLCEMVTKHVKRELLKLNLARTSVFFAFILETVPFCAYARVCVSDSRHSDPFP